jgi:hypothetical protein
VKNAPDRNANVFCAEKAVHAKDALGLNVIVVLPYLAGNIEISIEERRCGATKRMTSLGGLRGWSRNSTILWHGSSLE